MVCHQTVVAEYLAVILEGIVMAKDRMVLVVAGALILGSRSVCHKYYNNRIRRLCQVDRDRDHEKDYDAYPWLQVLSYPCVRQSIIVLRAEKGECFW